MQCPAGAGTGLVDASGLRHDVRPGLQYAVLSRWHDDELLRGQDGRHRQAGCPGSAARQCGFALAVAAGSGDGLAITQAGGATGGRGSVGSGLCPEIPALCAGLFTVDLISPLPHVRCVRPFAPGSLGGALLFSVHRPSLV